MFCMDANNVVLLLNELEDLGYVRARARPQRPQAPPGRDDRLGGRALARAEKAQEAIEDDVLQALDAGERATLWELLTRALYGVEPRAAAPAAEEPVYSATTASIST